MKQIEDHGYSLTQAFFGVAGFAFVEAPARAWLSLVPLGPLVYALVGVPLARARA